MRLKTLVALVSSVVLLAACAMAQYGDESDGKSQSPATIEGCVSVADGSNGRYTLTDPSGAVYLLTGYTNRLRAYVGQTIRVRGISSGVVHTPGAMTEGTDNQAQPSLSVHSFRRISGVCHDASNNP